MSGQQGVACIDREAYSAGKPIVGALRDHFRSEDYVLLPAFIHADALSLLRQTVANLLLHGRRRDFAMECMGGSPRRMHVVNAHTIQAESSLIPELYADPSVLALIASIVGESVKVLVDDIDRFVVNHLQSAGDTFGAHFDDYPLSLTIVVVAPDPAFGGFPELKKCASSLAALNDNPTQISLRAGDAYLLRSDTTAHRVSPLLADVPRTAINLAYTWRGYVKRETVSAQKLYEFD